MANLDRRGIDGANLACDGERGLMAYFMFRVLPGRLPDLLQRTQFAA